MGKTIPFPNSTPVFNTKVKKNTTHKAKLDNVLSISTDPIKNIDESHCLTALASREVSSKWATGEVVAQTDTAHESPKNWLTQGNCFAGTATGGGDRHFLEQTLCPRETGR